MKYCPNCGAQIDDKAVICVHCGVAQPGSDSKSFSDWVIVLLLCFFLGGLGVHRFYVGKTGTGVAQLLTCGGCGIWVLIDFIQILLGNFEDANGNKISKS